MEDYDNLLNNDLSKENIVSIGNDISIYDLYKVINLKFEELRSITQNDKIFSNKELFGRKLYKEVIFILEDKIQKIMIMPTDNIMESFYINKAINSNNINVEKFRESSDKYINKFVKKYYDEIIQVFSILEKYIGLNNINIEIPVNDYNFNIVVNNQGVAELRLQISKEDNKEMYNGQYYEKEPLIHVLEENKFELAKKFKIDINTLDENIQNIILENNKNNVKKIVK